MPYVHYLYWWISYCADWMLIRYLIYWSCLNCMQDIAACFIPTARPTFIPRPHSSVFIFAASYHLTFYFIPHRLFDPTPRLHSFHQSLLPSLPPYFPPSFPPSFPPPSIPLRRTRRWSWSVTRVRSQWGPDTPVHLQLLPQEHQQQICPFNELFHQQKVRSFQGCPYRRRY